MAQMCLDKITFKQTNMKYAPFIFILLSVAIFFVYIQDNQEKLKTLENVEKEYVIAQKSANDLRIKRELLVEKYKGIGLRDQDRLKLLLPDSVDNIRLLNDITKLAEGPAFGMALSNISISSASGDDSEQGIIIDNSNTGYGTIRVSFGFIATYEDFKRFLRALELSLRIMDIKNITVRTSEGALNSYTVVFDTYWLR